MLRSKTRQVIVNVGHHEEWTKNGQPLIVSYHYLRTLRTFSHAIHVTCNIPYNKVYLQNCMFSCMPILTYAYQVEDNNEWWATRLSIDERKHLLSLDKESGTIFSHDIFSSFRIYPRTAPLLGTSFMLNIEHPHPPSLSLAQVQYKGQLFVDKGSSNTGEVTITLTSSQNAFIQSAFGHWSD